MQRLIYGNRNIVRLQFILTHPLTQLLKTVIKKIVQSLHTPWGNIRSLKIKQPGIFTKYVFLREKQLNFNYMPHLSRYFFTKYGFFWKNQLNFSYYDIIWHSPIDSEILYLWNHRQQMQESFYVEICVVWAKYYCSSLVQYIFKYMIYSIEWETLGKILMLEIIFQLLSLDFVSNL